MRFNLLYFVRTGILFNNPRDRAHRAAAGRLAVAGVANEDIDVARVHPVAADHWIGQRRLLYGAAASAVGEFIFTLC